MNWILIPLRIEKAGTCSFNATSVGGKVLPSSTPATFMNSAIYIQAKDIEAVLAGNSTIATGIYASAALMSYS